MTVTDKRAYAADSSTTLTGSVNANAGDIVVAIITARSTVTLPSGLTLLYDSGVFASNDSNQRLILAYMTATTGGAINVAVTQASQARLYLNLVACGGVNTVSFFDGSVATSSSGLLSAPDKSAGASLIWGLSSNYWANGNWSTSPADLTFLGIANTPRNGTFIDAGSGAASGRTFSSCDGTSSICAAIILSETHSYKTSGSAIYTVAGITGTAESSMLAWTEDKPTGTSVAVSVSTDGSNYSPATNGGRFLPPGSYNNVTAYIKVELATTDATLTPTVSGLHFAFRTAEDNYSIILEMEPLQRFESTAGPITVAYNGGGTLVGDGGAVLAFTQSFVPTDLVPKPHQNDAEHIVLSSTPTGMLTKIIYINTAEQDMGHIGITGITATGALTPVSHV